jgi:hypothetical protein
MKAIAHAQQRMRQRAISEMQVRLIQEFGRYEYQKGGASVAYIPEKMLADLRHAINKLGDVAVVLGELDTVVTALHKKQRIHKTLYAT